MHSLKFQPKFSDGFQGIRSKWGRGEMFLVAGLRFFSSCENLRGKNICILAWISPSPRKQVSLKESYFSLRTISTMPWKYINSSPLEYSNRNDKNIKNSFKNSWFMCSQTLFKKRIIRHWRWDFTLFRKWHHMESWIHLSAWDDISGLEIELRKMKLTVINRQLKVWKCRERI